MIDHTIIAALPTEIANLIVNAVVALLTWLLRGSYERRNGSDKDQSK